DVNVAHTEIDIARPKENKDKVGFLPIERAWIDLVIQKGFVDVYRALNPDQINVYSWWDLKSFARDRNIGWRIDYFFVDQETYQTVKSVEIHSNVLGSDHCPISLEIEIQK
ncbi:MAG: exodeoxyribonuclease III, partial [Candidatus Taylorbacteria bacterium]|nr:exodeoxyribonuclease III [Candidatus Taylorbacteria bacterium]